MSRIHEALKKAEQERAANQGGVDAGTGPVPVAETPVIEEESPRLAATAVSPGIAAAHPSIPSFANPFTSDTLLARCTQLKWKPDHATMLFSNGEDTARGTESRWTVQDQ